MHKYDIKNGKYGKIFIPRANWDDEMTKYCLTHKIGEVHVDPALGCDCTYLSFLGDIKDLKDTFVTIEDEYGKKFIANREWNSQMTEYCLSNNVKGIWLNIAWGWRGNDLSFLGDLRDILTSFQILDSFLPDPEPIESLTNLKRLTLDAVLKKKIKLEGFSQLEIISLNWNNKVESVFKCKKLKDIFIYKYKSKEKSLSEFSEFSDLQSLRLKVTNIQRIGDLSSLDHLRHLEIAHATKLESLDGIEVLKSLKKLELTTCKKIVHIEQVRGLNNLEHLYVINCGKIESIKPLEKLHKLKSFLFYDETNIVDGDLSLLKKLPSLKKTSFYNRRHYNIERPLWSSGKTSELKVKEKSKGT